MTCKCAAWLSHAENICGATYPRFQNMKSVHALPDNVLKNRTPWSEQIICAPVQQKMFCSYRFRFARGSKKQSCRAEAYNGYRSDMLFSSRFGHSFQHLLPQRVRCLRYDRAVHAVAGAPGLAEMRTYASRHRDQRIAFPAE